MNKKNKNLTTVHHHESRTVVTASYSGVIPHPEMLKKYNEVLPGSAERLLAMTEQQAQHRQNLEDAVIKGNLGHQKLGLIAGTVITITAIVAGTILLLNDKNVEGLITILSMIGVDTGVFVFGRMRQEKERTRKMAEIDEPKSVENHSQ